MKKKVLAASKQKECEELIRWNKSLTNHLYRVAASTPDGDGDVMWAKWESVENHIHNVHEGHNRLFPTCAHEELEGNQQRKKWIKPGKNCLPYEMYAQFIVCFFTPFLFSDAFNVFHAIHFTLVFIISGTKASEKLSDIILSKQMKKDVPKLSPLFQTSQIEAFHSTMNHFAPKMVSFSYHGMYCRQVFLFL